MQEGCQLMVQWLTASAVAQIIGSIQMHKVSIDYLDMDFIFQVQISAPMYPRNQISTVNVRERLNQIKDRK